MHRTDCAAPAPALLLLNGPMRTSGYVVNIHQAACCPYSNGSPEDSSLSRSRITVRTIASLGSARGRTSDTVSPGLRYERVLGVESIVQ